MKTLWELCHESAGVFQKGNGENRPVQTVTDDSRKAGTDTLFVCLKGHRNDGADFAADAYRNGCRAFLTDRPINLPSDAVVLYSAHVRKTAAEILAVFYDHPERRLKTVGITGTKGKTSTAWMLRLLWEKTGYPCALIGTPGIFYGKNVVPTENTTPELFPMWQWLADFVSHGAAFCVSEVSSLAMKDGRVTGIPFFAGCFTSFGTDHVGDGAHRDCAEYLTAKKSFFEKQKMPFAVFDADSPFGAYVTQSAMKRVGVSLCGKGDVNAEAVVVRSEGTDFLFGRGKYRLSVPGVCQLKNALFAVSLAAETTGGEAEDYLPFLQEIHVPGRFEQINVAGRNVVIDYAHNPLSFRTLAETVVKIKGDGKVYAVFGSVGGREKERRQGLAREAERFCDFSFITSDNPDTEEPMQVCSEIFASFSDPLKARIVCDRAQAIRSAISMSKPGDTVLLLGKGHEEYQMIDGRKEPFSEKQILSEFQ